MRILLLSLFWVPVIVAAQSYSFIHYSVAEGLPSSEVYDIYQDRKGFIWFATDNGVVRFDGNEMKTYQASEGLSDPVVFGFEEDARGRLWFRTYSARLSYFENGTIRKFPFNDSLALRCRPYLLYSMYVDSLDQIWFSTFDKMGKVMSDGHFEMTRIDSAVLVYRGIGNGSILGVCGAGVDKVILNEKHFPVHVSKRRINTLHPCRLRIKDDVYLSINTDIFKFNGKSIQHLFEAPGHIISLSSDLEGNLWVGLENKGVLRIQHDDFRNAVSNDLLNDKSVTKVMEDRQHGYWVSTLQDGVYYIPDFGLMSHVNVFESKIRAVASSGTRTVVGDDKGFLTMIDNKTGKVIRTMQLVGESVVSLLHDSRNNFFVTTNLSTRILDTMLRAKKIIDRRYKEFIEDAGGLIWGISGTAIVKFDSVGKVVFENHTHDTHRSILLSDTLVIMSGRSGLDFSDRRFNEVKTFAPFKDYKISEMLNLNDSMLLVATIGSGFFVLNRQRWTYEHYFSKKGFVADNIYAAVKTDSSVWLGTEKGMAITTLSSLSKLRPVFTFIGKKHGLIIDKINLLSYSKPNILAFSDNSFTSIPEHFVMTSTLPEFYLKEILMNSLPGNFDGHKDLSHDQKAVQINFGFISFNNQNIFIRSRLSDNTPWSYTTQRVLTFYELAPGAYSLVLEYSLDNVRWNRAATNVRFTVSPPWWETVYIRLGIFSVMFAVIYLIFRSRVSTMKQKNQHQTELIRAELETVERERSRIAKDLHDGIGTNLTAIKMQVNQLLKKYNDSEAATVEDHLQTTIQDIKDIIQDLTPPGLTRYGLAEGLRVFIDKIKDTLGTKIEFHHFGDEVKEAKVSLLSFRIIQELISNSLKHSRAKTIVIHMNSFDDLLNIVYEDNGIGFNLESAPKGFGLLNIQSRIQSINGHLRFESGEFGISYSIDIPLNGK